MIVTPAPPTVATAFSPASVGLTIASTLTITLSDSNAFDLTQASLTDTLPTSLIIASSPAASTTLHRSRSLLDHDNEHP